MSAKPNYFKLGLFIIIATVILFISVIIFGSGILSQEKLYFETYFTESVQGLNVGAVVQNQGVEIGQVESISFVRHVYDMPGDATEVSKYESWIRVVCSVDQANLPEMASTESDKRMEQLIKKGLRLRLSSNILTGQGYIEATYLDSQRFPVQEFPWESNYMYVPSAP